MCLADELPVDLQVDLPADEGAHSEDLEWWYWTGHLQAEDGRWFGFELVFFLLQYTGYWGQIAHIAVTDVTDGSFHHTSTLEFGRPAEVEAGYAFSLPQATAEGGQGRDVLHGQVDDYVLDVELVSMKSPVYQHSNGYTDYPFGGNTYYYSRERMRLTGTLSIGGEELTVGGTAWFDHQWGELNTARSIGWDWFALQLDDGREIMLFIIREEVNPVLVGGSYTDAECNTVDVHPEDVEVTARGEWTSPHSSCTYPLGWDLVVNGMSFTVTPVLEDQELQAEYPPVNYWEGACTVAGDASGRAYVELTQYCD